MFLIDAYSSHTSKLTKFIFSGSLRCVYQTVAGSLEREFIKRYRRYAKNPPAHLISYLGGIDHHASAFHSQPVRFIGNEEKAKHIFHQHHPMLLTLKSEGCSHE